MHGIPARGNSKSPSFYCDAFRKTLPGRNINENDISSQKKSENFQIAARGNSVKTGKTDGKTREQIRVVLQISRASPKEGEALGALSPNSEKSC